MGTLHQQRECRASLNARNRPSEKKDVNGREYLTQALSKSKDFHKRNTRVQIWGRAKSIIFKKLSKHWLESLHLKRECGASLNAQKLSREKKVDRGENLSTKHYPNRKTSTSEIHLCRFGGRIKAASLKS